MFRCIGRGLGGLAAAMLMCAGVAQAQVQPYGTDDYGGGGFHNILPPGTSGFDNAIQLAEFEATGTRPPHSSDQLQMYSNLTTAAGSVTDATIPEYYKDATFGVPAGDVESTETPEAGVTIVRDKQFGVPHIYGDTRAELMFGIGYATAAGPAVLHRRAAPRRAGRPGLVRGRGQCGDGRVVWADRALHPAGSRQPGQRHPRRPRRRPDLLRRHQLRRRHQRLHRPGAAAAQLR